MATRRHIRRIIFIIPIIIFGLLTVYNFLSVRNGCYTMASTIFGIFSAFMTIAYTVILSLIFAYFSIFKKEKFDFLPLLTLGLVVITFFLTQQLENEKFKSDIVIKAYTSDYDILENREKVSIELRKNKKYSLRKFDSHYGCVETGSYFLNNDTLFIIRKEKSHVKGFDYNRFIVDYENNEIYVLNDKNEIDSTIFLIIK